MIKTNQINSSIDTDVLVIGGGIAGTSTAYHLAQNNHKVTLLERGVIASEASGVNAGIMWPSGWRSTPNLPSTLSMGSLEIFKTFQLELGYEFEFRQSGGLTVIQTQKEYDFYHTVLSNLKAKEFCAEFLTTREARSIEPSLNSTLLGCVYYPLAASAHPAKATYAFASAAKQSGARILTNQEVIAIDYLDDATYRVYTLIGAFHTKVLVIAAGVWSRHIGLMLNLDIPVIPIRAQMWSTDSLSPRLFHVIRSAESMFHWHKNPGGQDGAPIELTHHDSRRLTRHLYGRQTCNGEIIIGGDRQLGCEQVPDPSGIEINRKHAAEIMPFIQELPIKRTWAAWMPFTLNLEPIIGKVPELKNLYVLAGVYAGGFESSPMAGKLLADYIHSGDKPSVLLESDPAKQVKLRN